jgi:hypothetical protein
MEENHRLITSSITLSVVFNVLSWVILVGMNDSTLLKIKENCDWCRAEVYGEETAKRKANATEKTLGLITFLIGLAAVACWVAGLTLNSGSNNFNSSNTTIQVWYAISAIGVIFDVLWMMVTFKYWKNVFK